MTHKFSPLAIVVAAMIVMSSCLGNDNEDDTIYYDDTAISAFSLGTLAIKLHTTAYDGVTDSTYYSSISGSSYNFYIDQFASTIYNPDSLPAGTVTSHALATITTVNSGTPILNLYSRSGSDSLAYYSSTDSIDFTNPVRVRVYNMRASAYREYTVTVNVHKETADSFAWHSIAVDGLDDLQGRRFITMFDSTLCLVGTRDGASVDYIKKGGSWVGETMTSGISFLLGEAGNSVYELTGNAIMRSTDGGAWVKDSLDDSAANLPDSAASLIVRPSRVNDGDYKLILIGNRDGRTVVWSKVVESDNNDNPWTYYNSDEYNRKTLPYLSNVKAVAYDDGIIATGGDFTAVYYSPDDGLTWSTSATYALPEDFGLTEAPFALGVDHNNIMYISKDGSGEIWQGRLARLGWEKRQTVFTRAAQGSTADR